MGGFEPRGSNLLGAQQGAVREDLRGDVAFDVRGATSPRQPSCRACPKWVPSSSRPGYIRCRQYGSTASGRGQSLAMACDLVWATAWMAGRSRGGRMRVPAGFSGLPEWPNETANETKNANGPVADAAGPLLLRSLSATGCCSDLRKHRSIGHSESGGGYEIRTREGLPPTRFPSVRPRPLGESSRMVRIREGGWVVEIGGGCGVVAGWGWGAGTLVAGSPRGGISPNSPRAGRQQG